MAIHPDRSKAAAPVHTIALDGRRSGPGPAQWADDLSPVAAADWSFDLASQLLERAGFGGTPEDVARLANMTPEQAVASLVDYRAIRDYRKMEQQLALFHQHATGNFGELLIEVARGPAMLAYLDAAQNVKGAPNENFAREVMELFTMGVGNYSERDIREAARAFTGW